MKLSELIESISTVRESTDGKTWRPARPQTAENTFFLLRLRAAWRVLIGVADAVTWD